MTEAQLASRNAAIQKAWDDPLRRAVARARKTKLLSRNASPKAYNAYHRNYRKRCQPHAAFKTLYA